jgi:hypothetical protein
LETAGPCAEPGLIASLQREAGDRHVGEMVEPLNFTVTAEPLKSIATGAKAPPVYGLALSAATWTPFTHRASIEVICALPTDKGPS